MAANEIISLPISSIKPNAHYTRAMEDVVVEQIAQSFETEGQRFPIDVKHCEDGTYEIVSGHHRFAAAGLLGWEKIEARLVEEEKEKAVFYATNLFRSDLTPVDRAAAVIAYGETQNVKTNTGLAKLFGVTQPLISQLRSIHDHLEPEVKDFANEHRELTQVILIRASRKEGAEAQMAVLNSFLQTLEKKKEKSRPAGYDKGRMDKRLGSLEKNLQNSLDSIYGAGETENYKETLLEMRQSLDDVLGQEVSTEELVDDLKSRIAKLEVLLGGEEDPRQFLNSITALCEQMKEICAAVQTQEDELPSE